jgi:hypothetical protein
VNVDPSLLAIIVLLGAMVWFDWYCLSDLAKADQVWYLPRGAWAILVIAIFPLGGLAYLTYGRGGGPRPRRPV